MSDISSCYDAIYRKTMLICENKSVLVCIWIYSVNTIDQKKLLIYILYWLLFKANNFNRLLNLIIF